MVAQEFAIRFPERVDRLVLACTSSGGDGGASYPLHELASLPEDESVLRSLQVSDLRMDEAWREKHPEILQTLIDFQAPSRQPGAGEKNRQVGAIRQLEARSRHNTWDRLGRIGAPTLCCGGHHDGLATPANMERLSSRIPNAELEFFDGGHAFLRQDASAWRRIVEFLAGDLPGEALQVHSRLASCRHRWSLLGYENAKVLFADDRRYHRARYVRTAWVSSRCLEEASKRSARSLVRARRRGGLLGNYEA
jgi:3-oxoadipate enol-lactonase